MVVNASYMDIRVDPMESPYVIEKGKLVFVGEGWKSPWWGTMEFDRENRTVAYKTGDWDVWAVAGTPTGPKSYPLA